MANPQPTDAHLRIAHSINEQIMVTDFSKRQRKILDLILRLSWGCGKKDAIIPHQNDFEIVGVYEQDIKIELIVLERDRVIVVDGNLYSFNKDFEQWRRTRARKYTEDKLRELLSLNLNVTGAKLSKTLSSNLVKHEETTSQNTKFPTPELASPKERLNKVLKKDTTPQGFNIFWESYPRKVAKQEAIKVFIKINPDQSLLDTMLGVIEKSKKSFEWQKDNGAFIPHPATWLNGRRWEDEITEIKSKTSEDGW